MGTLILNFKNYASVLGAGSLKLALAANEIAAQSGVEIIVAPPNSALALVAAKVSVPVFSQAVGSQIGEKTTGADVPGAVKAAGAVGTLLNHSEMRMPAKELRQLVPRVKGIGLKVCLCAKSSKEAASLSRLDPEYVAVEPPELIGSGIAVSRARPEVVSGTVEAVKRAGYTGKVLCGAGIVDGRDVERAMELGVDGILVASSVVNAKDWRGKIRELSGSLV